MDFFYQQFPQFGGSQLPSMMPAIENPDKLIKDLPYMDMAVSDFNSVPMMTPPFRDIPSILIATMNRPQVSEPEPDWEGLLRHFASRKNQHGKANLEDLYMFMVRVVIPNCVVANRMLLLDMYLKNRHLPVQCRLRYDSCVLRSSMGVATTTTVPPPGSRGAGSSYNTTHYGNTISPYDTHPCRSNNTTPTPANPNPRCLIPTRPIFRSLPTPDGNKFMQWLQTPPNTPYPYRPVPIQMLHRKSNLDAFLVEDETEIRSVNKFMLMVKTIKAFELWWWMVLNTAILAEYKALGWRGIERTF